MSDLKQKGKFKSFFYDNRFSVLAFFCSAAIMIVVFMCFNLIPFGDKTILRMDLYHQYGPLFSELYDRLTEGKSLLYSWQSGLGSSFIGNFFNYLSSPLGIVVMLISGHENMPEAISVMILLKAALSALTLSCYLKSSQKKSNYATTAFAVLYSFCGWFIAYYWNVMWLDAMVILPLSALGIEKIINNGKAGVYIASLALTLFTNYYMGFMMCIFSVLYFLVYFISNYSFSSVVPYSTRKGIASNRFIKSGFIFAFSSFCAAGLMAASLIPTFLQLRATSATTGTFPKSISTYFSIFDFLCNHIASVNPTIRSSGDDVLPNVYCGIIVLILLPLYLLTKSISKKEKAAHIALLGIFLLGFNYNFLNYIWHGFHFPNDLPYRQSFMYSFILILIAFKTFTRLKEIPDRYILFSGIGTVLLTVMAQELKSKNVTDISVLITIVFASVYVLILVTLKDKRFQTISVSVLLLCTVCSEAIIADTSNYSMDQPKLNYAGDYSAFQNVKSYIDEINTEKFYRMELSNLRARMDPSWYNYNGVSTFSSMAYQKTAYVQKRLGMYGNEINSYTYNPQTEIYNSLFGLKYIVNNKDTDVYLSSPYMTKLYSYDKFTVYQNENVLPLGYCVDTSIVNWYYSSTDPFDVQNDLFEKATGNSDVLVRTFPQSMTFTNIEPFSEGLNNQIFSYKRKSSGDASATFTFKAEKTSHLYFYVTTSDGTDATMTVTTPVYTVTQNLNRNYAFILDIGQQQEGDYISAVVPLKEDSGTINFYACYIDDDVFSNGYEKLKAESLNYSEVSDTLIKGTFKAEDTKIFMTTVPFDPGWSIYIDGKKVNDDDIVKIGDTFIGVYATEGLHEIEMKYFPQGLRLGIIVSLSTLMLLGLFIIVLLILKRTGRYSNKFDRFDKSFDDEMFSDISDFSSEHEDYPLFPVCEVIEPFEEGTENEKEKNELRIIFDKEEFEKVFNDIDDKQDDIQDNIQDNQQQ